MQWLPHSTGQVAFLGRARLVLDRRWYVREARLRSARSVRRYRTDLYDLGSTSSGNDGSAGLRACRTAPGPHPPARTQVRHHVRRRYLRSSTERHDRIASATCSTLALPVRASSARCPRKPGNCATIVSIDRWESKATSLHSSTVLTLSAGGSPVASKRDGSRPKRNHAESVSLATRLHSCVPEAKVPGALRSASVTLALFARLVAMPRR